MTLPTVFIASSSEGLDVVRPVEKLLERALSGTVELKPWTEAFQLTKVYIESLERLLDTSDFAVMVLTPDDQTTSREAETASPRDNVVFELGLFFGRLGRERCFLIKRRDLDLKLPSDLLGIEPANFSMSPGQDLETALDSACARIGKAIRDATIALPSRPKLGDAERAAQTAIRRLGDRITGTWWERIWLKGKAAALSFVTIELDEAHSSDGSVAKHMARTVLTLRTGGVQQQVSTVRRSSMSENASVSMPKRLRGSRVWENSPSMTPPMLLNKGTASSGNLMNPAQKKQS